MLLKHNKSKTLIMAEEKDQKTEERGDPTETYRQGREGQSNIIDLDTPSEKESRERGEQDKINAEQTQKEQEEADKTE
jgi:hypothetical protein